MSETLPLATVRARLRARFSEIVDRVSPRAGPRGGHPVMFWNHELAPEDPPPDIEFPVIAPDLASFLDMLYEDNEPLPELPRPWWRRVLGR